MSISVVRNAAAVAFLLGASFVSDVPARATPLGELVARCAPHVAPRTALAIIAVESGGYPWTVNDNDTKFSHHFASREKAESYLRARLTADAGASIDIGLAQLNSANMRGLGLSIGEVFDPCTNVAMGMRILQGAYASAVRRFGPTRRALFEAFAAYNGGTGAFESPNRNFRRRVERYANTVWDAASSLSLSGVTR